MVIGQPDHARITAEIERKLQSGGFINPAQDVVLPPDNIHNQIYISQSQY